MTEEKATSREIAIAIGETIAEKLGRDVRVLDMRELTDIADWFVIASAQSRRHLKVLADELIDDIKSAHIGTVRVEGLNSESWVIIDIFDVVVHIFMPEKREFFGLEGHWGDAPSIVIEASEADNSGAQDDL